MNDKYISVTQLTKYIKYKIDNDQHLQEVCLKGEISNFKAHTRGHFYFTLKDENSRINAVMFQTRASSIPFTPTDGMNVLITGKVSVYEANGGYQIYVNDMLEDGVGNLYVAYEQLKQKLEKEGLFDQNKKKTIPKIPETIGIVTAPTGAAIKDVLSTLKRRWPLTKVIIFPALVQGADAAPSIVHQIKNAEQFNLDVLIVGRGGGSIEDMWCFNDESVARAIYESSIPIISAVGHEVDFTIADFVADLRAPTPTGAAEMAVPNIVDIKSYIDQLSIRASKNISNRLDLYRQKLNDIKNKHILKDPSSIYMMKNQKFDHLLDRLRHSLSGLVFQKKEKYLMIKNHRVLKDPTILIEKEQNKYIQLISKLEALNPLLTIKRGYAVVKSNDQVITKVEDTKKDQLLSISLSDGDIEAKVI